MSIVDDIIYSIYKNFLSDIHNYLRKANIKKDPITYSRDVFKYSIIVSVAVFISTIVVGVLLSIKFNNKKFIVAFLVVAFILTLISFVLTILFLRYYPKSLASSRKKKIESNLYLASLIMATTSTSGSGPLTLFKVLSRRKEFGELQKEAQDILNMVENLGMDLPSALHKKAMDSPSLEWTEFLEGMRSIIVEGGDLEKFLYSKSYQYIQDFKRRLIEYTNIIQVILEIYITLIVLGVIFIIILTSLMGSILGGDIESIKRIQYFVVLVLLPVASIMFILFIKSSNPFSA